MNNKKISIIVPVYNEERLIENCLDALINLDYPKEDYEILVVNDGSTDGTLKKIEKKKKEAREKNVTLRIINLKENMGRVIAREIGAKNAKYNNLLFIDSRCVANKDILTKIAHIGYQPIVGTLIICSKGWVGRFNYLIRKKIYRPYFGTNFKPVYITKNNFDRIPKGTGIFFCDKELFLSSQLENKSKHVSDDIKLLWNIVQKKSILKHPDVVVTYYPRTSLKEEIMHTYQRGPKLVDYYFNLRKKYFWLFIFIPILMLIFTIIAISTNFNYFVYWFILLTLIWIFASIWFAENIKDIFILMILLPVFGVVFELGVLKGLWLKIREVLLQ